MASIKQRGENSYLITVSNGYSKGRKLAKTKTITLDPKLTEKQREKELQKAAALFEEEVQRGTYLDPSKLTLSDYATIYLESQKNVLAPRTYCRYKGILEGRVDKALGDIKLQKINSIRLDSFYENLQEDDIREDGKEGKLSSKTVLYYHRVLHKMFHDAFQKGLVNENPCDRANIPKVTKHKMNCLDENQIPLLIAALEDEPIKTKAIITLLLVTGCRRGELGGLQWKHVDLKNNTILIEQAVTYTLDTGTILKAPKTESSVRKIIIPQETSELLSLYRKWWLAEKIKVGDQWQLEAQEECKKNDKVWTDPEYVFTTWNGYLQHPDSFTKLFKKFLVRHNLPIIRLHDIRHTAATMLINAGLDIRSVADRMGHENPNVTLAIYSHALLTSDQRASDVMSNLIKKDVSKQAK